MKWDVRFLRLAKEVSTWSKDPGSQVGAVIADSKHRLRATGYNGFPPGIKDDERLQNRSTKLAHTIHAEDNAIAFSFGADLRDCSIYIFGLPPCSNCSLKIIRSGIRRVVSLPEVSDSWREDCALAEKLLSEANIETVKIEKFVFENWKE
ncbi:CMP deaminase [bacterium]|nr:CMP deaminase [bacterium]|tara:strand:- start:824 stop:1273 length:450 start_codon:yes stop_codon:yes gene_type:complete